MQLISLVDGHFCSVFTDHLHIYIYITIYLLSANYIGEWRLSQKQSKKLSCCCDSRSYCVRRTVYWKTIKTVSVTS